jgi:uncharacterized membrane protein YeaQ/YmgE (transglycosylase-associated protein family)
MFFQNDLGFTIYGYIAIAVIGMLIGLLTGWLSSIILKLHVGGFLKNALLGGLGSTIGFFASNNVPWPRNTVSTSLGDHGVARITMNRFQYPEIVAFIVAALFPIVRQIYRLRRSRQTRVAAP